MIKVSIIVPCYNTEKYITQCLNSIMKQTLREIEIICVNDGSTDSTLIQIKKCADKDSRIVIIDKKNSGYGDSMNQGLAAARGIYIGIVESDDFIEPNMFEVLYTNAIKYAADIVKSNFWLYWTESETNVLYEYFKENECGKLIAPSKYESGTLYGRKPSIWSAIYKREFIEINKISFLPTPGASYQDTSFTFKVYTEAQSMICLYEAFIYYRQDNEYASINNREQRQHCIFDEYSEIERYIKERNKDEKYLYSIYGAAFYDACIWMYEGLTSTVRYNFLKQVSKKFKKLINEIDVNEIAFGNLKWKYRDILRIAEEPYEYHMWRNEERYEQNLQSMSFSETITPLNNITDVMDVPRKNNSPQFTVIIPVYNIEKYLPSALDSLLYQTYDDFEIICINDGSTDHSLAILESYAKLDDRVIIINQENAGVSNARNKGLLVARGKYVLFMDGDDYLCQTALEVLEENIKIRKEPDAIEFGALPVPLNTENEWLNSVLSTPDTYYSEIDSQTFLSTKYFHIYCWRYCIKLNFIKRNNGSFKVEFKCGEDALFLFDMVPKMQGLLVISDKLYHYRTCREKSLMNCVMVDRVKYAEEQLKICDSIISVAYKNGFFASTELLEYICDFVYSSIDNCPQFNKQYYIVCLLKILRKYGLEKFVEKSSGNCKGFYKYCIEEEKKYKYEHSLKIRIRHFIAKIIPPSRKIFYEHSARIMDCISLQQQSIRLLQQQLEELQDRLNKDNGDTKE